MKKFHFSFKRGGDVSSKPGSVYEYEAIRVYRARLGYNSQQYVYVTEGWDTFDDVQKTLYVFDNAITGTKEYAENIENKNQYVSRGTIQTNVISGVLPESEYGPVTDGVQYSRYWITYDNSTHGLMLRLTGNTDTRKCYVYDDPETGEWVYDVRDVEIVEVKLQDNSYTGWMLKSSWDGFYGSEGHCTQVWEELCSGREDMPDKTYPEIAEPEIYGKGEAHWTFPTSRDDVRYRWFEYNGLIYYIEEKDSTERYGFILKEK